MYLHIKCFVVFKQFFCCCSFSKSIIHTPGSTEFQNFCLLNETISIYIFMQKVCQPILPLTGLQTHNTKHQLIEQKSKKPKKIERNSFFLCENDRMTNLKYSLSSGVGFEFFLCVWNSNRLDHQLKINCICTCTTFFIIAVTWSK